MATEDRADEPPQPVDGRRVAIQVAAIDQFSQRGFAGTSMANIAEAAGMSRPALYQYFRNKTDIFASAFVAMFDHQADESLAALNKPGTTFEQLDGFLQRFEGDLWERMAASPHSDEILTAKTDVVHLAISGVIDRLGAGLAQYLLNAWGGNNKTDRAIRDGWQDVLHLSPKGFKLDQPSVAVYRQRLTTLARSVGADIDRA